MAVDRIEVGLRPGTRRGRIGLIIMGLVFIPGAMRFLVDPPRYGWFGTSGFLPRVVAVVFLPAVLYMIAGLVWSFVQRGPELMMDGRGLEAKTLFRVRRVRWDEIANVKRHSSDSSALLVYLKSGDRFRVAAAAFEPGWDRERIVAEMRRLSGGRVRASTWNSHPKPR